MQQIIDIKDNYSNFTFHQRCPELHHYYPGSILANFFTINFFLLGNLPTLLQLKCNYLPNWDKKHRHKVEERGGSIRITEDCPLQQTNTIKASLAIRILWWTIFHNASAFIFALDHLSFLPSAHSRFISNISRLFNLLD